MLVLTQKEGEILQVGDDVRIYIKRIKGNWVRLCIDAPKQVELKRIPAPKLGNRDELSEESPMISDPRAPRADPRADLRSEPVRADGRADGRGELERRVLRVAPRR